jgi:hypothetical protein
MPVTRRNALATVGPFADDELFSSTAEPLRHAVEAAQALVAATFWQSQVQDRVLQQEPVAPTHIPSTMLAQVYVSDDDDERQLRRVRKVRVVESDDEAW